MNKQQTKELFEQFGNGNGHLSLAEIDGAIVSFYPEFGKYKKAIMQAYKEADTDGNGLVELNEFGKIVELRERYDEISKAFDKIDANEDGRISFGEFKKGFDIIGDDSSDEDNLKQEFDGINPNNGGYILFDEFCMYMAKKHLH